MRWMGSTALLRTRWAAIGAAVAVTLGFGGMTMANASISSGERSVFVPITPCRLVDTRSGSPIGPRNTPIQTDEQFEIPARGQNGQCSISAGATAIVLNVTAVNPVGDGYLTIWPADAPLPNASNVNFVNGQAPSPNMVTTKLGGNGAIRIYSSARLVDVIVDVAGYYEDHTHDDRYATGGAAAGPSPFFEGNSVRLVTADGSPSANGTALRSILNGLSGPAVVRLAPGSYDLGGSGVTVPGGVSLLGNSQMVTTITSSGSPIVTVAGASEIGDLTITGSGGLGAAIDVVAPPGTKVVVHDVTMSLGGLLGSVNNGNADVVMERVTARSKYGINNSSGTIRITDSDIDNVVQNPGGGQIVVQSSALTPLDQFTAGAIAYSGGTIRLDNVDVKSATYGVWPFAADSSVFVSGSRIFSPTPRTGAGTSRCADVVRGDYLTYLSTSCT